MKIDKEEKHRLAPRFLVLLIKIDYKYPINHKLASNIL